MKYRLYSLKFVYKKRIAEFRFKLIEDIGQKNERADVILFAKKIKRLIKRLLALWHRFKEGEVSRDELIKSSERVRASILKLFEAHRDSEQKEVCSLSRRLLKRQGHLFTFILHEGVEPTNNSSERGLRPAVQWRKVCFGNRSDDGALLTGRVLTATRTCWLQNRNPLEFLVGVITAYRSGYSVPPLLLKNGC
jgi:hypothetical protein